MISFKHHIILDKIDSWPDEILALVTINYSSLKGFLKEEHRIDKSAREDLSIRYNRPHNIHQEKWKNTIYEMERVLKKHLIVGIHCTKLIDYEIADIRQNGLRPLSKDFTIKRDTVLKFKFFPNYFSR